MSQNFADRLIAKIIEKKSFLCVGLDPQLKYFPPHILQEAAMFHGAGHEAVGYAIFTFNRMIIDATYEFAAMYKPQIAFYEKYGSVGIQALEKTIRYLKRKNEIVTLDTKREDGGDTAQAYADAYLGEIDVIGEDGEITTRKSIFDVDAMTVTAWIGSPMLKPCIEVCQKYGKGLFVVARTSFKPTSPFQESVDLEGVKGWVNMVRLVKEMGLSLIGERGYSSIGAVMGATYPEDAGTMCAELPMALKLIPGLSVQGGTADSTVACFNEDGLGGIGNDSRGINYAWHPISKSEFQCNPKDFASAAAKQAEKNRLLLNEAVVKKCGKLPW